MFKVFRIGIIMPNRGSLKCLFNRDGPHEAAYCRLHTTALNNCCYTLSTALLQKTAVVDSAESFRDATDILNKSHIIGFDMEWKPVRTKDVQPRLSLLQVATHESIHIFDVIRLNKIFMRTPDGWDPLRQVFMADQITKVGLGVTSEFYILESNRILLEPPKNVIDLAAELNKMEHAVGLDRLLSAGADLSIDMDIISKAILSGNMIGLSKLCQACTGLTMYKSRGIQLSNWEERPLSDRQMHYAALDAYILLVTHDRLNELVRTAAPVLSLPLDNLNPPAVPRLMQLKLLKRRPVTNKIYG